MTVAHWRHTAPYRRRGGPVAGRRRRQVAGDQAALVQAAQPIVVAQLAPAPIAPTIRPAGSPPASAPLGRGVECHVVDRKHTRLRLIDGIAGSNILPDGYLRRRSRYPLTGPSVMLDRGALERFMKTDRASAQSDWLALHSLRPCQEASRALSVVW